MSQIPLTLSAVLVLSAAALLLSPPNGWVADADYLQCGSAIWPSEMMELGLQNFYKNTGGATKWPAVLRKNWDHKGGICAFDGNPRTHAYNPPGTRCLYNGNNLPPPKGHGGVNWLVHGSGMAEGPLPAEFKSFFGINIIDLANNKITGTLWDTSNHCQITALTLNNNQMSGTIPGNALTGSSHHLAWLNLADNKFTGSIPFKETAAMVSMILDGNQLTGELPDMSKMKEMRQLSLSGNKLSGTLGHWFEHLEHLKWVELDNNSFTGPLPDAPKSLSRFTANGNKFSGEIPQSWVDDESMLRYFSCIGCDLKCPKGDQGAFNHLPYSTHCRDPKKARKWEGTSKYGDAEPNVRTEPFAGF